MRVAVVVFPGTNCERDVRRVLRSRGAAAELVWHRESSLRGYDAVVLPGGFAHGDYLRTGAIARFSPVMDAVADMASAGAPVLGICNGFQVLCEAGLLPGALVANRDLRFICRWVHLRVEPGPAVLTRGLEHGTVLHLPLNSYQGNWVAATAEYEDVEARGGIVLRYCDAAGEVRDDTNPNGAMGAAAAVCNEAGNVVGIMPHPERASDPRRGSEDGVALWDAFLSAVTVRA